MAEAFGIVSGTFSLASIFSSSVECFKYIQLGRHFDQDYQQSLVTLNLLESRLSRWGTAVGVYDGDPQLGNSNATSSDVKKAEDAVFQILRLFSESKRKSQKFSSSTAAYSTADINDSNYSALVNTTSTIISKRKKGPGLLKLASWVIYERDSLKELSIGISQLMDLLEQTFPAREAQERLTEQEVTELCKVVQLEVVEKVTQGVDELLKHKARDAITQRSGHTYGLISVRDNGQATNGNVITGSQAPSEMGSSIGFHNYQTVEISGNAKVHNGDWLGGSPF